MPTDSSAILIIGMSEKQTIRMGRRGTIVIPARLRRRYALEEGSLLLADERPDGILLRPAVAMPVEISTPERKAELLLSGALDADDYARARDAVRKMGLDPDAIPHEKPRDR
jgi:AbrB family looped-hinge helix DNA binding protein